MKQVVEKNNLSNGVEKNEEKYVSEEKKSEERKKNKLAFILR